MEQNDKKRFIKDNLIVPLYPPNSSAIQKQTQIQKQLQLQQQQQAATLRGKPNSNKRVIVAGGSSHFRHSSNSIKKALIAQAGQVNQLTGTASNSLPRNYNNVGYSLLGSLQGGTLNFERDSGRMKLQTLASESTIKEPFSYKLIPAITYESGIAIKQSSLTPNLTNQIPTFPTQESPEKHIQSMLTKQTGIGQSPKKFIKIGVPHRSQGLEDINKELQSIMEKEKQLTDEIIKNSLVKNNGRFNYEALANINEIIQSKKQIKRRLGLDGGGFDRSQHNQPSRKEELCMVIKSYSESTTDDLIAKGSSTSELPNAVGIIDDSNELNPLDQIISGVSVGQKQNRMPEFLIKSQTGSLRQALTAESPQKDSDEILHDYTKLFSVLNGRHTMSQGGSGIPINKRNKKRKTPSRGESAGLQKDMQQTQYGGLNAKSGGKTKIKIFHQEDTSKKHMTDHPINKAIQKINYLIRLIFKQQATIKNTNDQIGGANLFDSGRPTQGNSPQINSQQASTIQLAQQTSLQQHLSEEQRVQEIQRVTAKWFGITLPMKRLESKGAFREYFNSREFTGALRNKMNAILHGAINKSNKMVELLAQFQSQQSSGIQFQRFYVAPGNNDAIVRGVLKQRFWWQQFNTEDFNEVQFLWNPWKKQTHIDYLSGGSSTQSLIASHQLNSSAILQSTDTPSILVSNDTESKKRINSLDKGIKIYNRMEQNKQLTNKKGVFLNMREYYYMMKQDPFEVLPMTFLIKTGKGTGDTDFQRFQMFYQEVANEIKSNQKQCNIEVERRIREIKFELRKRRQQERAIKEKQNEASQKKVGLKVKPNVQEKPKISQWKSSKRNKCYYGIGTASGELLDMDSDEDSENEEEAYKREEEETKLIETDEKIKEIKEVKYPPQKNIWIVKPGENSNRGTGINVCSEIDEIKSLVLYSGGTQSSTNSEAQDQTFIIQRYIDNPLLIHQRKFDFRCYGVMTSMNGNLKGYFYEDAYIRTSCKEFDIEDVHNKFIHLTNDAVQKFSQDYGKYENGNKLSMYDLQKYLKITYPSLNIDVWRDIMPQIRKLVTDSYRAVYGKIDPSRLHNTFEMFGYDFMLDSNFRLYLIEVNTNPCLEMTSPLLARIIPDVLDNTFRIVLDPIFPCPEQQSTRKYNLIPQEIKYTLVFDEDIDGPELTQLRAGQNHENSNTESMVRTSQQKMGNVQIGIIDEIESDQEEDEMTVIQIMPNGSSKQLTMKGGQ